MRELVSLLSRAFVAAVALGLASCTVTGLAERDAAIARNECNSDSDCADSGGRCQEGMCVASDGRLSSLLFEVAPAAYAGAVAGERFLSLVSMLPGDDGRLDFDLDEVSLVGRVQAAVRDGCDPQFVGTPAADPSTPVPRLVRRAADQSIPVQVSFVPSERRLGLDVPARTTVVDTLSLSDAPSSYRFGVHLPGGIYDVYVVPFDLDPRAPLTSEAGTCALAPQLIRGQAIAGNGASETQFELSMPEPAELRLDVHWPVGSHDLVGWTADIIEDREGRVISNRARLELPARKNDVLVYSVALAYLPVVEKKQYAVPANPSRELVRLTPPANVLAPVVLFERTAIELFSPGRGVINQLPRFTDPVTVQGLVLEAATRAGRPAQLTFIANELAGAPAGTLTAFSRSAESRADGRFSVELLPGTYEVHAVPGTGTDTGEKLAAAKAEWVISSSPAQQAGRAVELLPAVAVNGRATLASGEGARGALISAEASPWMRTSSALERELRGAAVVPHATSTTVADGSGAFTLYADPGTFDLYVRTPEGSALAWYVKAGVALDEAATNTALDLKLPLPLRIHARASLLKDRAAVPRLAGALVRAYALIDENGTPTSDVERGRAVFPVAESRLDVDAATTLLVPASLDAAPSQ